MAAGSFFANRSTVTGHLFELPGGMNCLLFSATGATTDEVQRKTGSIVPWVFSWTKRGRPLKGFTKAWRKACLDAGVPGRIPHDFRRTAVRNLERAGVPRSGGAPSSLDQSSSFLSLPGEGTILSTFPALPNGTPKTLPVT
jgi:hypothetical protein